MVNKIPLKIEAAYNIRTGRIVDLSNDKTKVLLQYMLISKKCFDVATVIEYINDYPLGIANKESVHHFIKYLTSGNSNISREAIINHILNQHSELENHMNYRGNLTLFQYKNIIYSLNNYALGFNIMPQIIELKPREILALESREKLEKARKAIEQEIGYDHDILPKTKRRKNNI